MTTKIKVLIADDHPVFRKGLIQVVLGDPQLQVVGEAEDGDAAVRMMAELKPDVVILDIEMPGQNGMDVARAIQNRKLPVEPIFMTAYKDEDMFNEALNLGVKGYILKDSAVKDIIGGIKAVAKGERFMSPALSDFFFQRAQRSEMLIKEKPGLDHLTPTERKVLKLVSLDKTSKEIAEEMGVSHRTVENHRANIASKLALRGSHSLLKFAFDHKSQL